MNNVDKPAEPAAKVVLVAANVAKISPSCPEPYKYAEPGLNPYLLVSGWSDDRERERDRSRVGRRAIHKCVVSKLIPPIWPRGSEAARKNSAKNKDFATSVTTYHPNQRINVPSNYQTARQRGKNKKLL